MLGSMFNMGAASTAALPGAEIGAAGAAGAPAAAAMGPAGWAALLAPMILSGIAGNADKNRQAAMSMKPLQLGQSGFAKAMGE